MTNKWPPPMSKAQNQRRADLIYKRCFEDPLTPEETTELDKLQKQCSEEISRELEPEIARLKKMLKE